MKEKPILFSAPMVRAIMAGRKTQTRRVMVEQPNFFSETGWPLKNKMKSEYVGAGYSRGFHPPQVCSYGSAPKILPSRPTTAGWVDVQWQPGDEWERVWLFDDGECWGWDSGDDPESVELDVRFLELTKWRLPGDRLWVRETFGFSPTGEKQVFYRANEIESVWFVEKWKPSIFMPRSYSRITLEVVSVRVERVRDISESDAIAEGIVKWAHPDSPDQFHYGIGRPDVWERDPREAFARLWDSINAKRGHSWASNPWVWVVEFKRVEK